jgi:hypothetical protein
LTRIDDEIKDIEKKMLKPSMIAKIKLKLRAKKRAFYLERAIVRTEKQKYMR